VTPHYTDDAATLYHGDALAVLRELPDASVDAVVTDPPYAKPAIPNEPARLNECVAELLVQLRKREGR
jgi:predicted methyltransferase